MAPASTHDEQPDRRRAATLLVGIVAVLLVTTMITRTSQAAFVATTDNSGNSFSAASITLTDDDIGSAMFTMTDLEPGDSQQACIEVTYNGSVATPSAVHLYSGGYVDNTGSHALSTGLSTHLNVTVEEGTGAAFGDCSTFAPSGPPIVATTTLAAFDTASGDYLSGAGTWTPSASPESRAYRVTVELDTDTPSEEQGASTTDVQFVWEVQS